MIKQGMPPAHPGEVLKGFYFELLELLASTITNAAAKLGIASNILSQLVNGRMGVRAEMALRLSKAK